MIGVALLALLLASWRAYEWFVQDVEQRRAIAEGRAPDPAAAQRAQAESKPVAAPPAPTRADGSGDPPAPAVLGDALHRCVRGDQVLLTNLACPQGYAIDSGHGDTGTGAVVPTATRTAPLPVADDPAQREALCRYLAAEVERLDYDFRQPLPPPVLDAISTRLATLRSQGERLQCVLPQPREAPAPAPARAGAAPKVLEERASQAPPPQRPRARAQPRGSGPS